jgi:flagellar biosynthesis component FlhA
MRSNDKQPTPIEVAVEFDRSLHALSTVRGVSTFKRALRPRLNELVDDLELPASISLTVAAAPESAEDAPLSPFVVTVGGHRCRVLPTPPLPSDAGPLDLARAVTLAVWTNRELLLTPRLCDAIRGRSIGEDGDRTAAGQPPGPLLRSLRGLIRRCFAVGRSASIRTHIDQQRDQVAMQSLLEQAVAGFDRLTLKVLLPSEEPDIVSALEERLATLQAELFYELGIILPRIQVICTDAVPVGEFRIQINDMRLPPTPRLRAGQAFVDASADLLTIYGYTAVAATHPTTGTAASIIMRSSPDDPPPGEHGYAEWDDVGYVGLHVKGACVRHAAAFLNIDLVSHYLNSARRNHPVLVDAVLDRYDPALLTQVLGHLLDEQVSIRDLRRILECLVTINGRVNVDALRDRFFVPDTAVFVPIQGDLSTDSRSAADIASIVRMNLQRQLVYKYSNGIGRLPVLLLDGSIEDKLRRADENHLTVQEHERIIRAIQESMIDYFLYPPSQVILTTTSARRRLRQIIDKEFPHVAVLSYEEIPPDTVVEPVGRIAALLTETTYS